MNKEEIDTILKELEFHDILSANENICLLEYIKLLQQQNKKYKEVIDSIEKYIEKETRIYGLSLSLELGTHFDNILGKLKEVE